MSVTNLTQITDIYAGLLSRGMIWYPPKSETDPLFRNRNNWPSAQLATYPQTFIIIRLWIVALSFQRTDEPTIINSTWPPQIWKNGIRIDTDKWQPCMTRTRTSATPSMTPKEKCSTNYTIWHNKSKIERNYILRRVVGLAPFILGHSWSGNGSSPCQGGLLFMYYLSKRSFNHANTSQQLDVAAETRPAHWSLLLVPKGTCRSPAFS